MNSINLKAYAKVNLSLDIVGLLENGYHLMEMVMQSISLADDVLIELVDIDDLDSNDEIDRLNVICNPEVVGDMKDNIAYKVAIAFFEATNITDYCVKITINKEIPSQAGLGGGSSDGASVLIGLNKLFRKKLSLDELIKIGSKISADLPFCLVSNTAKVTGFGEIVTPIKSLPKCHMVIVKPNFSTCTKTAFAEFDKGNVTNRPQTENLINAIEHGDLLKASNYFLNVFEEAVYDKRIQDIKKRLKDLNAISPIMSGSGSAIFGIFQTEEEAKQCYFTLCDEGYCSYMAHTVNNEVIKK